MTWGMSIVNSHSCLQATVAVRESLEIMSQTIGDPLAGSDTAVAYGDEPGWAALRSSLEIVMALCNLEVDRWVHPAALLSCKQDCRCQPLGLEGVSGGHHCKRRRIRFPQRQQRWPPAGGASPEETC